MYEHVLEWLGAYLDGELSDRQLHKVETHLKECQVCLEEYLSLQALSVTLQSSPVPEFPAPERIAAEVALRLPRTPVKPVSKRVLEFGWWLAPVGLVLTWIFLSTTLLVSNLIATANGLGLLGNTTAWLASGSGTGAYFSGALGQFGLLAGDSLKWAELTEAFTRNTFTPILWQASMALLYLSWIAIWWARQTRQGAREPLQ